MIQDIFMPALSSTMTEGKIVSWVKSPGDPIAKGETVLVVESDKADMDVEAFYEGFLGAILVPAGESAPVGATIGFIAETAAEIEIAQQRNRSVIPQPVPPSLPTAITTSPTPSQVDSTPDPVSANGTGRLVASPRARKLAKELKVDLTGVKGTGPHGRVQAEDVEAAVGKQIISVIPPTIPTPVTISHPAARITPPSHNGLTVSPDSLGEVVPLSTLQQAVVRNMLVSLSVPVFRVGYTIATDNLDALYKKVKSKGVTMTTLLAKAVAITLQKHPLLNASYTEQGIQYHRGVNVAVAVAMDDGGLVTPVLVNADELDLYSLSRNWKDLVDRARLKQLSPNEYNTGTFTLSNLGMFGVDRFDAILPPGQGAILAIAASQPNVVVTASGTLAIQRQMQVNLTCDHRIIYGTHAASFLKDLATLISTDPQSLTL